MATSTSPPNAGRSSSSSTPPRLGSGLGLKQRRRHLSIARDRQESSSSLLLEEDQRRSSCWRLSLRDVAEKYFRSYSIQMGMLGLCIFSCILFVIETYQPNYGIESTTITLLEVFVSLCFLADYVLTIVFALDRWRYIFSFSGAVDLLSILPLGSFLAFHFSRSDYINVVSLMWLEIANLFRILRALKVFRVLRFSEASEMSGVLLTSHRYSSRRVIGPPSFDDNNSVSSRVIQLSFWLIGTIFVATGVVWLIDKHENATSFSLPADIQITGMTWFDALYFVAITLATVGYGEIVPASALSRIVVLCFVFFFLCTIPYQIGKLMEAISSRSMYRTNNFRPLRDTEHIVVLGRVTFHVLASFIEQFLHGGKILEHHFRLVVLSPNEPDPWLHSLLQHPRYRDRVVYLQGSPWNSADLARACAGQAQAIFVTASFEAADIARDSDRILLTAVAARKYLIRQYDYAVDAGDDDIGIIDNDAKAPTPHAAVASARREPVRRQAVGQPSLRRLGQQQRNAGSSSLLGQVGAAPSSLVQGAWTTLTKGLLGRQLQQARREAEEGEDAMSDRVVIQTHSTGAMEELARGLGFRRTYCPHVLRLRLMAYGTVYPGLMSWMMNLLRGDPFLEEDKASRVPMPEWYRAFRAGAQQRIVRYHVDIWPGSQLEGRSFAEVARYLYRWFGVLAVAVELSGVFLLNPHGFFRFSHARAPSVLVYFIASGVHAVREALEALHHNHWDGMDVASTLAEAPLVELKPSDLPPARTETLQRQQQSTGTPHAPGLPARAQSLNGRCPGGSDCGDGGVASAEASSASGERRQQPQPQQQQPQQQQQQQQQQQRHRQQSLAGGGQALDSPQRAAASSHHELLAAAYRLLGEAHEAHEAHRTAQQWQQLQALGVKLSGVNGNNHSLGAAAEGKSKEDEDEEGAKRQAAADAATLARLAAAAPNPSSLPWLVPAHPHHDPAADGSGPLLLEPVLRKLQGARDTLTQLLDVAGQRLPRDGLRNHVVLGLCNEAAPSPDAFVQYVAALRKLIHLPLVVLCADSEKFASLLHGVRQRLRQSSRPLARHVGTPPGTRDIYFVQGSPKKRTDLDRCCVEAAYGVVLLGDDVPRKRGADDGEADPVLQDRHVLLSSFKLESILQQRLYSQVLTIVDLRNEVSMDLLRQSVRPPPPASARESTQPYSSFPHSAPKAPAEQPAEHVAVPVAPSSPPPPRRSATSADGRWDHQRPHGRRSPKPYGRAHHPEDEPRLLHKQRPVDRASMPERGCPLFAAGRVCARSFFDVLFIYLYKNPYALRFWKELIRSRLDDLAADEFQMGSGVRLHEKEVEEQGGGKGTVGGPEDGDRDRDGEESVESAPPEGYTGRRLFADATGHARAPAEVEDLQDSIDLLRSTVDMLPLAALPPAFVGLPYGELVDALLHLGVVAMGLYRPRGHMEATMPFALVNPPASTRLVRGDAVYVLRPGPLFSGDHAGPKEGAEHVPLGQLRREKSA